MIEGLANIVSPKRTGEGADVSSEASVESIALAGAAAIQRVIADRDSYRNRIKAQEQKLASLDALNKDLLGRIALIRHHYVEMGTKILAQLEQFDRATREAIESKEAIQPPPEDDAKLVAIAHRLKPRDAQAKT